MTVMLTVKVIVMLLTYINRLVRWNWDQSWNNGSCQISFCKLSLEGMKPHSATSLLVTFVAYDNDFYTFM